jgi:hypothetical protein
MKFQISRFEKVPKSWFDFILFWTQFKLCLKIFKTFNLNPISMNQKFKNFFYFSFLGPSQFGPCSLGAHLLLPNLFSFFRHFGPSWCTAPSWPKSLAPARVASQPRGPPDCRLPPAPPSSRSRHPSRTSATGWWAVVPRAPLEELRSPHRLSSPTEPAPNRLPFLPYGFETIDFSKGPPTATVLLCAKPSSVLLCSSSWVTAPSYPLLFRSPQF